jgi:hypothetical protein
MLINSFDLKMKKIENFHSFEQKPQIHGGKRVVYLVRFLVKEKLDLLPMFFQEF